MKFEEIPQKMRDAADVVGKKTADLVEEGKLVLKLRDTEKDMEKAFYELGRLAYEEKGVQLGAEGDAKIAEIDAIKENYVVLREAYAEVRGEKFCSECHTINNGDSVFCKKCGARFDN